jgi:hypothetical protein
MKSCQVTFHSSLTVQSYARQLNVLINSGVSGYSAFPVQVIVKQETKQKRNKIKQK